MRTPPLARAAISPATSRRRRRSRCSRTAGLASIAQRYGSGPVVAVDPHSAPAVTDFGHGSQQSSWDDFRASLRTAGVEGSVEAHRAYSRDLAKGWDRPIRFLWIDGDHT